MKVQELRQHSTGAEPNKKEESRGPVYAHTHTQKMEISFSQESHC